MLLPRVRDLLLVYVAKVVDLERKMLVLCSHSQGVREPELSRGVDQ